MKKIIFIFVFCMLLCGCNSDKTVNNKISKTACIDNSTTVSKKLNMYTWYIYHADNLIVEKTWIHNYEYDDLSQAIEYENKFNEGCKEKTYNCSATRNNKIVNEYLSYKCGEGPIEQENCNYLDEIKDLEKLGFECEEKDTNE